MKIIAAAIILGLLHFSPTMAQSSPHRLGSIRRVDKVERLGNKPVIEIEVVGPHNVGGMYYCLHIGNLKGIPESFSARGKKVGLFFHLSVKDWKKLKEGTPLWITWGCMGDELYEKLKPFAFLNKKSLAKDSSTNRSCKALRVRNAPKPKAFFTKETFTDNAKA